MPPKECEGKRRWPNFDNEKHAERETKPGGKSLGYDDLVLWKESGDEQKKPLATQIAPSFQRLRWL
jgi:hypothetical protein